MLHFVAKRVLAAIPVMLAVAVVVFMITRLGDVDPARVMAGDRATDADVEALRHGLGLDRSLLEQFIIWVTKIASGDLGQSIFYQSTVLSLISQRIGPTVALATSTMIFACVVGIPAGALAAWNVGRSADKAVMALSSFGFSIPIFVVAYFLVYVFSLKLQWLPVQGYKPISEGLLAFLSYLILPTIALGSLYVSLLARASRATVLDVLKQDYIATARAKGASPSRVLFLHALRNAAIPIVTVAGSSFAVLLGGVVITESLFNIPGIGRLVTEAILKRDFPIIQGVVLVFAFLYVLINLAIDIAYAALDPRIRQ